MVELVLLFTFVYFLKAIFWDSW